MCKLFHLGKLCVLKITNLNVGQALYWTNLLIRTMINPYIGKLDTFRHRWKF